MEEGANIARELEALQVQLSAALGLTDKRTDVLLRLVRQLSQAIATQAELIELEGNHPTLIEEEEYFTILNTYLRAFKIMRKLPRAQPDSVYEIALISCLDTILKKHCRNQPIE